MEKINDTKSCFMKRKIKLINLYPGSPRRKEDPNKLSKK